MVAGRVAAWSQSRRSRPQSALVASASGADTASTAFDLVVSSLALSNIREAAGRAQALREAVRVLRPGGRLRIVDDGADRHAAVLTPARAPWTTPRRHQHGPVFQYVMPGNCSRARSSWPARSRGQPKARAAWPLMSAAAAPLVKWTYSPQFIRRV